MKANALIAPRIRKGRIVYVVADVLECSTYEEAVQLLAADGVILNPLTRAVVATCGTVYRMQGSDNIGYGIEIAA